MVKTTFAKTGKSYPNLLYQCANLPWDICTQSEPGAEFTQRDKLHCDSMHSAILAQMKV